MTFIGRNEDVAKNEKDNLSKAEQAALVELSKALVAAYGDRA